MTTVCLLQLCREGGDEDDAVGEAERIQDGRSESQEAGRAGASQDVLCEQQGELKEKPRG